MAEQLSNLVRDTELEEQMLAAVIQDRNNQPRNRQLQVGPSSIGFCRELLRAGLFESETLAEPETHWATSAHIGSIVGEDLERIFSDALGAITQQRVTCTFPTSGLSVSGALDLAFLDGNQVSDLKSTDDIGGVLYDLERDAAAIETLLTLYREGLLYRKYIETPDGGYELTDTVVAKLSKLSYYVQLAIYVAGCLQAGILDPGATARIVYYDRSGQYQGFVAIVITAEQLEMFLEIAEHRMEQVANAQIAYEATGANPAVIAHLRDKTPSFCFSPKVQCARRMHCWAGSDWTAANQIAGAEIEAAVDRYEKGRSVEKVAVAMKKAAREELKGISGVLPDGRMVTWAKNGAINVVSTTTTVMPTIPALLDEPAPPADPREARAMELAKMRVPSLRLILSVDYDLPDKGVKVELIERIIAHEFVLEGPAPTSAPAGEHERPPIDAIRQMQHDADERRKAAVAPHLGQ